MEDQLLGEREEGQDSGDGRHWKAIFLVQTEALQASFPFLPLSCFSLALSVCGLYVSASLLLFPLSV